MRYLRVLVYSLGLGFLTTQPMYPLTTIFSNTVRHDPPFGVYPGGAGGDFTGVIADDLRPLGFVGWLVNGFGVRLINDSAMPTTFLPLARFWSQGATGLPGAYLYGHAFDSVTLGPGETVWLETMISGFILPSDTLWAGMQFRSFASPFYQPSLEAAGPPSIGSSDDHFFFSEESVNLAGVNNPAGGLYWLEGNPSANFAWEIHAVTIPEPGTLACAVPALIAFLWAAAGQRTDRSQSLR